MYYYQEYLCLENVSPVIVSISLRQLIFFVVFGIMSYSAFAQEFQSGANLSKHTVGYSIGYAYPKLARGSEYISVKSEFNYGISASFEWGKYYKSGISFMAAPSVYYSDINNTEITYYSYRRINGNLVPYWKENIQLTEVELCFPLSYEFPAFKLFRFGVGTHISFPLITTGSIRRVELPYNDEFYDIDYNFEATLGVSSRLLYQIHRNAGAESYLALDYWYDISFNDAVYAHKTRFALSFIHRKIQLKDVREKWDRYLIQKERRGQ